MAGRTTQPSRRRASASTTARRPVQRGRQPARKTASRPAARRRRSSVSVNPLGLIGRAIIALWMGLAHILGWVVRAVGRQAANARDLDPEHRRDGVGLAMLGFAVLLTFAVWFNSAGPVGAWLADTVRFFLGAIAAALPIVLLISAVRLMRKAVEEPPRGRGVVGWTALLVGVAGLLHLIAGQPIKPLKMEQAGGVLGRFTGGLLAAAVTNWVAVPLLVLLAVFGVLVVTATPINKIPERLANLRDLAFGRLPDDEDENDFEDQGQEDGDDQPGLRRRASRRRSRLP
jgi:S-DNA-T family DNA segregation ATPase FtsK/SpoIIIE